MKKMLAVAVVSMMALTAQAGIEADFVLTGQGSIDGNTFNIYVLQVTTDTDWTNSLLEVSLSAGSFGNHAFGSKAPPIPALLAAFPELGNDTYLQTPDGQAPSTAGTPVFPSASPKGDTKIAVSWFDTTDTGAGTHTIAQLAITMDAVGTISGRNYDIETAGVGVDIGFVAGIAGQWPLVGGEIGFFPEPATLGLLALGGLVLLRHKRRR